MGHAARHLSDGFHLLGLLQSRLYLPALCDLLTKLLVGLFELLGTLPHLIFQLRGECLSIEQMVLHLVLTLASPHRGPNSTDQSDRVQRTLEERNVSEAFEQAHAIGLRGCGSRPAGQYDEGEVGPGRLLCNTLFQSLRSATEKRLLGHQRGCGALD